MNKISKTNKYFDSLGNAYTQDQVNRKVRVAKLSKLLEFKDEHGYYFCEDCGTNEHGAGRIDCSHEISIQKCKNERMIEKAWDVDLIKLRCRRCHQIKDKLL